MKLKRIIYILSFVVLYLGTTTVFAKDLLDAREATVLIQIHNEDKTWGGMGTGFFVNETGQVLTNYHVIHRAHRILVWLYDRDDLNYYVGEVIGNDPVADLALLQLKLPEHKLPVPYLTIEADLDKMEVSSEVYAVGHPMGLDWSITKGIINNLTRTGVITPYVHIIQHTAQMNQGNSGGPLLNLEGNVVGVNTYIMAPKGGDWTGVGYATRGDTVYDSVVQMIATGEVSRPALRMGIGMLNEFSGKRLQDEFPDTKIPNIYGLIVGGEVEEGSYPALQGIKRFDTIVAINGQPTNNMSQLEEIVSTVKPDDIVTLMIIRDYHFILLEYKIAELVFDDHEKYYDERRQKGIER